MKNVFFYLFIAILCAKMSSLYKPLERGMSNSNYLEGRKFDMPALERGKPIFGFLSPSITVTSRTRLSKHPDLDHFEFLILIWRIIIIIELWSCLKWQLNQSWKICHLNRSWKFILNELKIVKIVEFLKVLNSLQFL